MPHSHTPHFFQPLLPGFETAVNIPISFYLTHLEGHTVSNTWTLRSDASDLTWEVLQEERRLTRGWQKFTEAHGLRVGDILIFKLEAQMVFHVNPFGPSCCSIRYTAPQPVAEEQQANTSPAVSKGTTSAYWDYTFRAEVTESSIEEDKLMLPVEANACPALNKRFKEAILLNIDGKPWTVRLRFSEPWGCYIIKGWWKFCRDNKCQYEDAFAINIVGDGMSPPLFAAYAPNYKEIGSILKTWKKKLNVGESSRRLV